METEYEVVEIRDLDKRLKKLYERGQEAVSQKNLSYAMEMYRELLKRQPGALEVRLQLRGVQFAHIGRQAKFMNQLLVNIISLPFFFLNLFLHTRKDDASQIKAMDNAEKMLGFDCTALVPILMADRAGYELELPEISVQTLEWALQFYPKNQFIWDRLGQAYAEAGQGTKALAVYKRLTELSPQNKSYQDKYKDAQAEAAIEPWAPVERGEGDYRDVIRDKDAAARLEQAGHTLRTPEGLRLMIEGVQAEIAEGETVDKVQRLADLYAELKEWEKAAESYERVIELSGVSDPAIEQAIIRVKVRKFDTRINELERAAQKEQDESKREELMTEARQARVEKVDTLLEALRDRVMKYPNEYLDRMELAKMLIDKGEVDEALSHFQKLQMHPQVGIPASLFLGRCFFLKHVYDLAVEQYTRVIGEIRNMTPLKKEAYYDLAKTYEAMGNQEEALANYKILYASDVHYRDVGQIVERHTRS